MKVTSTFRMEVIDESYMRIDKPAPEVTGLWYFPTDFGFIGVDDNEQYKLEAEYQKAKEDSRKEVDSFTP